MKATTADTYIHAYIPTSPLPSRLSIPQRSLVEGTDINVFIPVLTELSNLTDGIYAIVANAARSILIEQTIPTVEQRRQKLKVGR